MAYTIKDLKEDIKNLSDDMKIVLQVDAEGNGFKYVTGIDPGGVVLEDGYSPAIADSSWTADDAGYSEDEWEDFLSTPRVAVIYP